MAPFKFKLEQVRLYRKQLEEQAMQALAEAVAHRESAEARVTFLQNAIIEQRTLLCRADAMTAAERWLAQSYATALKADLVYAFRALREAEELADKARAELVQKAKERELLDSLKEKQSARHMLLERQEEQRVNDETATLRYKPAAV